MKPRRRRPPSSDESPALDAAREGWATTARYALLLVAAKPFSGTGAVLMVNTLAWWIR